MDAEREFLYTLALELGQPNPDLMAGQMQPIHVQEWKAFFVRNLFGDRRRDHRIAMLALTICRALGNEAAFDVNDFFRYPLDDDSVEDDGQYMTGAEITARYKRS